MKRIIKASYEDKFWNLHDRDYQTGTALEAIVDDMGLEDKFYGDEISATEAEYKAVLDRYQSNPASSKRTLSVLIERLCENVGVADLIF